MEVTGFDVFLLDLPLTEPFVASHGSTVTRTISVVRVSTDVGVGWGECSALPAATYTAESAAGSFDVLAERIGHALVGRSINPNEIGQHLATFSATPMAKSGAEMALLDALLTAEGRSLAEWLTMTVQQRRSPTEPAPLSVPAGVSIGLGPLDETVKKCRAMADDGYQRLKVKVEPGHDLDLVSAIRGELPTIELQVDANGAYPGALEPVLAMATAGADVIEQPFPTEAPEAAAGLISAFLERGMAVPVVADEAVERLDQAVELVAASAMTGLSIKPGRVGGFAAAARLHDLCVESDIGATAGGMLETALGRHALVAIAALPGFTITGDLSPAARWLAADPWPDVTMTDGRLLVPSGPGVAPDPDLELLEHHTTRRATIRA